MRYTILVCESMTDDPIEELGGRTPLEVAKTPFIDLLSKKGKVGSALFTPHSLSATSDAACMSILGSDPLKFYTGIASLEAIAMDIPQNDQEIAFRCDLVTVLDEMLVDVSASRITPTESELLIGELNQKLSSDKIKFYPGRGYKNILVIRDPELVEALDDLECIGPSHLIAQKFSKYLPKGKGSALILDLMDRSKVILENHEINRVRIDLKENPANMIWPWGQGKKPKLPGFKQQTNLDGVLVSEYDAVRGIGKALGLEVREGTETNLGEKDLLFVYKKATDSFYTAEGLKNKIRLIEEFDTLVVGPVVKKLGESEDWRLLITTDTATSISKKSSFHGHVPFLIAGGGVEADGGAVFSEKFAAGSGLTFNDGYKLMEFFLKGVL